MEAFIKNIKSGLCLAFGLKVSRDSFVISTPQLCLFMLISLGLVYLYISFSSHYAPLLTGSFAVLKLFALIWGVWLLVLLCLTIIFGFKKWREFLIVTFASNLVVSILQFYSFYQPDYASDLFYFLSIAIAIVHWLLMLFSIFILSRCLKVVYETQLWKCIVLSILAIGIAYFVMVFYAYKVLFSQQPSYTEEYNDLPEISIEKTYYNQTHLLQTQIDALTQNKPDKRDLYFISFASYAHQDVFKKEINYVRDVIQQRFSGLVQSAQLINHEETLEEIALANKPNLQKILNATSSKMDIENDVAMVYLTSHGSKEGELSASLWPIDPEPMNATQLREILDASKIKWRIIFVSACYSGTFIEPLKTEHSLIITASAKDKTSFGCDNNRELTYFAEAYFQEALPASDSLLTAFDAAKIWVTEKEISEEKNPSKPQIFIGKEMQHYLEVFESQFSR